MTSTKKADFERVLKEYAEFLARRFSETGNPKPPSKGSYFSNSLNQQLNVRKFFFEGVAAKPAQPPARISIKRLMTIIADNDNITAFLNEYLASKLSIADEPTASTLDALAMRLSQFLRDNGVSDPRIEGLVEAFLRNESPGKTFDPGAHAQAEKKGSPTPLPKRAPERWPSDPAKRTENPAEFTTRVYGTWMQAGMVSRQFLKDIDPRLFLSLDNYLKNNRRKDAPDPLPKGFNLLSERDVNDRWIDRIRSGQEALPTDPAELSRFALALRYRSADKSNSK